MIAKIISTQKELREILDSLHSVASGEANISMDLNLIADPDEGICIYVRNFDSLQVVHEITDPTQYEISEYSEFVFNSKTLHELIKDSDSDRITLQFYRSDFEVMIGDDYFTTPTKFELNLVHVSEFEDQIIVSDFISIDSFEREGILDTMNMMDNISPVVKFRISNNEFWISVSDVVQGEGEVMKEIEGDEKPEMEFQYPIRPIRDFLKRLNSDTIDLSLTYSGTLKIEMTVDDRVAQLICAPRID